MKIAVFQGPSQAGDPERNLALLAKTARQASQQGVGLLILSEMFLTGYNIGPERVHSLAEPADGRSAQQIARIAKDTGIALLYGYPERAGDRVYNAAQLIDRNGQCLANHRKTHLFGAIDRDAFSAGSGPPTVAELDGLRLGILICYDVEFPENVRLLALAGVDFVAVPTALMQPYDFIAQSLVCTRAYENQVFLAYANRCGQEHDLHYQGLSCIIGPDGSELARAGNDDEALISAELDRALLERSRQLNTYLADRQPEQYVGLTRSI
jgi:predicted amidohydrolase